VFPSFSIFIDASGHFISSREICMYTYNIVNIMTHRQFTGADIHSLILHNRFVNDDFVCHKFQCHKVSENDVK